VCRGCHAEISYGPPGIASIVAIILPLCAAWYVTRFVHDYLFSNETLLWIVFLGLFLPGLAKSMNVCGRLYKHRVWFKRFYRK